VSLSRKTISLLLAMGMIAILAGCDSEAGSAMHPVPPLVGLSSARAERALRAAGFVPLVTTAPYPARAPAAVVAQDPAQGQPEPRGTRVRIVVAVPGPTHVVVPDLVGEPWARAAGELIAKGLASRIIAAPSSATAGGVVATQSPQPGSLVPAGARVTLRVRIKG
jgi:beta-lactam-binding protein with PASTA domain